MWGVSLTHPVLVYVGSFSYTPHAMLCGEFLLHAPCSFMRRVSLTRPMLSDSFSDTPHAMLFGQFLLQAPCYVIRTVSLTRPMLFYAESFSYTPRAILSGGFSYMPQAILCEEFFFFLCASVTFGGRRWTNQCKNTVSRVKSAYRASGQASVVITWLLCLGSGRMLSFLFSGHRLLRRRFTMDRHSWSGFASVQTPGRQRLRHVSPHYQSLKFVSSRLCSFLG